MSYVLTYAVDGHEYTADSLTSLDEVNAEIRDIYDRNDEPVAILRIEQDHDGPRTWQIEYPPAPPAGTRVYDRHGNMRTVGEGGRVKGSPWVAWKRFLEEYGPLTEVVETEVEAAARRLQERLDRNFGLAPDPDAELVLRHVLNGGTL